jgi:hypothetical protein
VDETVDREQHAQVKRTSSQDEADEAYTAAWQDWVDWGEQEVWAGVSADGL